MMLKAYFIFAKMFEDPSESASISAGDFSVACKAKC